jgi:hypothetical protein
MMLSAHSPHIFLRTPNRLTSELAYGVKQTEDFISHYIMQYYLNKFNITTQATADVQINKNRYKKRTRFLTSTAHKHQALNELHVYKF